MIDLKAKPFYLTDSDIQWVEQSIAGMTLDEKIGQLFCPLGVDKTAGYLEHGLLKNHIGGVMYRTAPADEAQACHRYLQEHAKIPLLIGANLECGGDGALINGTRLGSQMQVAATGTQSVEQAYRQGKICAREGGAIGVNWTFAPIVDIDMNWRNPITNVRTYGNDPEKVLSCAKAYKQAMDESKMAAAVKHFPGDGWDEVDQHLLTSVNGLSCNEWDMTYGKIYRGLIEDGALTVMVGHVAMPAYQKRINPEHTDRLVPATLSPELLGKLLREQLGFNGMIVTDATPMVGFTSAMRREEAVPYSIAAGCDMFLFNVDLNEDIEFMKQGYLAGIISEERLTEALTRILGTKAAMGLHVKARSEIVPQPVALSVVGCDEHVQWSKQCADQSITLVKDRDSILPIDPKKTRRVLLQILGDFPSNDRVMNTFQQLLEEHGFAVERYLPETMEMITQGRSVKNFFDKYDLVLYLGNIENASNKTTNRISWHTMFGHGNNLPWFVNDVPTIFISLANPYHLVDVPMIGTYINCYSNHNIMLEMLFDKLVGKSSFKGTNPVDPFCGKDYLKY